MVSALLKQLPLFLAACQSADWGAALDILGTLQSQIDESSPWFAFVNENTLPLLDSDNPEEQQRTFELWQAWLFLLENAAAHFGDADDVDYQALIEFSRDASWPSPFAATPPAEDPEQASLSANPEALNDGLSEGTPAPSKPEASPSPWPLTDAAQEMLNTLAESLALFCREAPKDAALLDAEVRSMHEHNLGTLESAAEMVNMPKLGLLFGLFRTVLQCIDTPAAYAQWRLGIERLEVFLQQPSDKKFSEVTDILENFGQDATEINTLNQTVRQEIIGVVEEVHSYDLDADSFSQVLPADVNSEVIKSFQQEAPYLIAALSSLLEVPEPDIAQAERLAHTLKGNAALVGLHAINTLTHLLEDVFERIRKNTLQLTKDRQDLLLEAADMVGELLEKNLSGEVLPVATLAQMAEQLKALAQLPHEASQASVPQGQQDETASKAATADSNDGQSRVESRHLDALLQQVGELQLALSRSQAELALSKQLLQQMQQQDQRMQTSGFALETLADLRGMRKISRATQAESAFDPLELEEYQEWYSLARQLLEISADSRSLHRELQQRLQIQEELLRQEQQYGQGLQEYLIDLRLVPIQSLLPRLQRIVRQTCRSTGKLARLQMLGGETLLDEAILQALFPALLHLLRNAVDHGIEAPDVRLQKGKNSEGSIALQASRDGKFIVLKLKDDGAGLDLEKIRRKAQSLGLAANQSEEELKQLIFSPNFSTREQVTTISGRGVGLDVVARTIEKLQGSITVESKINQGITFNIRLPLTLATLQTLFVSSGQEVFGLPANDIARIVLQADLHFKNDRFVFEEKLYRVIHLGERLGLGRSLNEGFALFFRQHPDVALLVDNILENKELILRPLSRYLPPNPLYLGNSIRENGAVVMLLNTNLLLQMENVSQRRESSHKAVRSVLVVDDSLSMRKALSELVQDAGFSVVSARDGAEAVQLLDDITPLAMLVDMEMPRMNGLELTRYVRNNSLFQKMPIAMITSRASDKHRQEAEKAGVDQYFTKPFQEEAVMSFLQQAALSVTASA
jgi:chemosensory pili system protein ChpA (sensor histidine kinase/response regulator)